MRKVFFFIMAGFVLLLAACGIGEPGQGSGYDGYGGTYAYADITTTPAPATPSPH